jgi:hypothetical protein
MGQELLHAVRYCTCSVNYRSVLEAYIDAALGVSLECLDIVIQLSKPRAMQLHDSSETGDKNGELQLG